MDEQTWWRVIAMPAAKPPTTHGAMTNMQSMAAVPEVIFVNTSDFSILSKGEEKYAAWLATRFSHIEMNRIQSVTPVTKFNSAYNFTDKRLPVWLVSYAANDNDKYFIETATGRLSVRVSNSDLAEGYSFALFHKHHFMDWAGKSARDASTMVWAFMQVVMITIGLILWWKMKAKSEVRSRKSEIQNTIR
jgi:hypothetical protein